MVLEFVLLAFLVIGVVWVDFWVGLGWVEVPAFFWGVFGYDFPLSWSIIGMGGHGWWKSDGASLARETQTDYAWMKVDGQLT